MVMHARKPQRIGDGYHFEKHQAHPYQNSKYGSSKSSYDRERMRERDSPNGNSYRSESPECDSPRDRERLYHTKTSSYISKSRDRDYKSRDKYSDCARSPKDKRSRIDSDHRTNHDRNSSEKMLLNSVKTSQNSSRETSQRKVSSSCQDKREERERVSRVGDWSEHVSSSGKKYYYNCKTEVSQWEKPREWVVESRSSSSSSHRHPHPHPASCATSTSSSSSSTSYLHHSTSAPSSSHPNSRTGGGNVVDKHSNSRGGGGGVVSVGKALLSQQQASQAVVMSAQPTQLPQQGSMVPPPQSGVAVPGQVSQGSVVAVQGGGGTSQGGAVAQCLDGAMVVRGGSVQPVPVPTAVPPPSVVYWSTPHHIDAPPSDPRKQDPQPNNNIGMGDGVGTDMEICSGDSTPTSETSYGVGSGGGGGAGAVVQQQGAVASCEGGGANTPGPPPRTSPPTTTTSADTHRSDRHSPPTPVHENQDCKVGGSLLPGSLAALRPQGPNLTPSLANHYRDDLVNHVRGWPAELIEKQAQKIGEEAYQLGAMCARVSAELKCPRSKVRQTEIQATRQEQRVLFLRQQIKTLEELKSQNSFMADEP